MVELQDVSFSYTKEVGTLTHVDLTIRPGECVLLCGASGCGKTTITKLVNGLIPAFTEDCTLTGQVLLHGAPVREQPLYQLARQVGSVFQNPKSQFFNMDSDSELAFGLENQGMTRGEILRRLDDTTDRLHLKRLRGRNIFAMSGGEKQLLAFASVYAMGPKLYILDEPTANLDRETIERLHDQIAYLKSRGHTILIAEHRLYFLADLIDRAVYLRDGIVERIWSGAEFRRLAETERIALGLRTLTPTQVTLPPSRAAGEQDGLSVEGLSCRYKREPPVFQNLSFSARPGEVLAVTGDNGVGKSTLSRCLCGLMRESAGTIRLNGRILGAKQRQRIAYCVMQDVNHQLFSDSVWGECQLAMEGLSDQRIQEVLERLHLLAFREKHPMVFQNVYLFHDTIRNNIRFGRPDAAEEDVIAAAKAARCHDFIMALPQGYDTIVGEGGSNLSGGEKQRISIARCLLKDAPIIILDEATASVDPENEHEIQEALSALVRGKTIITIAHRLATIQNADRILVVEDGRIAQQGTHQELMSQEGIYRNFIEIRQRAEGWRI